MFDIGFAELLVCLIVALLVLGPERLPGAVRTVGRWIGRARHTVSQFTDQIDREMRAEQLKQRIEEEIRKSGVNDLARDVQEALHAPLNLPDSLNLSAAAQPEVPAAPVAENSIATPAPAAADTEEHTAATDAAVAARPAAAAPQQPQ